MKTATIYFAHEYWGSTDDQATADFIDAERERICSMFRNAGWEESDELAGSTEHHTLFTRGNYPDTEGDIEEVCWFELWCADDEKELQELVNAEIC